MCTCGIVRSVRPNSEHNIKQCLHVTATPQPIGGSPHYMALKIRMSHPVPFGSRIASLINLFQSRSVCMGAKVDKTHVFGIIYK